MGVSLLNELEKRRVEKEVVAFYSLMGVSKRKPGYHVPSGKRSLLSTPLWEFQIRQDNVCTHSYIVALSTPLWEFLPAYI